MKQKINMAFYFTGRITQDMQKTDARLKAEVDEAINKYSQLDFGKVPREDVEANINDLRAWRGRVLGRYDTYKGNIYLDGFFKDADTMEVTICYCSDY